MQARLDACDLAVRVAQYEQALLVHQLDATANERMKLQVGSALLVILLLAGVI
jgi:hypothetical protein